MTDESVWMAGCFAALAELLMIPLGSVKSDRASDV